MESLKVKVGYQLPNWTLEHVSAERMRVVAAILRDPNPVHWDASATAKLGLGDRVVNQSPINLSYIQNMLMEWAGPSCIKRLRVEFPGVVFDGDRVTAGGVVTKNCVDGQADTVECEVWLDQADGRRAVQGVAVVALPTE